MKKTLFTLRLFLSVDSFQLNLNETSEHNAPEQKNIRVQPLISKRLSSTFVWNSLYFNMCLALLSAECLNMRLIQALYHTYLKPGEVKL